MESPTPYHLHLTQDGSPTLSFGAGGEWMHNREGAFSESLYVYGEALNRISDRGPAVSVLVVGLGLGYLECLTAAHALSHGWENWKMISFESDSFLREEFVRWLLGAGTAPKLVAAYNAILAQTSTQFDVSPKALRAGLVDSLEDGRWHLHEALELTSTVEFPNDAILFDPFSAETSPKLWDDAFLRSFVEKAAKSRCIFATYASRGNLKRVLESLRFTVDSRGGFGGKRECTLAHR